MKRRSSKDRMFWTITDIADEAYDLAYDRRERGEAVNPIHEVALAVARRLADEIGHMAKLNQGRSGDKKKFMVTFGLDLAESVIRGEIEHSDPEDLSSSKQRGSAGLDG